MGCESLSMIPMLLDQEGITKQTNAVVKGIGNAWPIAAVHLLIKSKSKNNCCQAGVS